MTEVGPDARGLQDTWPPRGPYPTRSRISRAWGGQGGAGDTDAGLGERLAGGVAPQGLCVGGAPRISLSPSFRLRFSKTTFLRDFLCYKICRLEVVSSVFAKVCSRHHSLTLEYLNSPRRNHAHRRSPAVPSSPQPQATLFLWIHQFWGSSHQWNHTLNHSMSELWFSVPRFFLTQSHVSEFIHVAACMRNSLPLWSNNIPFLWIYYIFLIPSTVDRHSTF